MCGSGLVDCVAELVRVGLLDHSGRFVDDETAGGRSRRRSPPRLTKIGEERVFVLSWRGERPGRRRSSSRSATCASCSSRRRRSRPAGRSCSASSAIEPEDVVAGAAGRLVRRSTCRPPARSGSGSCRGWRCRGSSPPATSPARARRSPRCQLRERAEARSIVSEVALRRAVRPRRLQRPRSSTSWRSRDEPHGRHRLRRARRRRAQARAAARLGRRRPPGPRAAAQPARADPARRSRRSSSGCAAATTASPSPTPTAAPTARSTRCWRRGVAPARAATTATTLLARDEVREALAEEPGTYLLTDFLARTFEHTVCASSASTATPSCATPTSATTRASSGSRSGRRSARARPPSGPRPRSGSRSRCARWATRASSAGWNRWSAPLRIDRWARTTTS